MSGVFDRHRCPKGECQVFGNDTTHPFGRQSYYHSENEEAIYEYTNYDGEQEKFNKRFWNRDKRCVEVIPMTQNEISDMKSRLTTQLGLKAEESAEDIAFLDREYQPISDHHTLSLTTDNSAFVNQRDAVISDSGALTSTTIGPCVLLALVNPGGRVGMAHVDSGSRDFVGDFLSKYAIDAETRIYIVGGNSSLNSLKTASVIVNSLKKMGVGKEAIIACDIGGRYQGDGFALSKDGVVCIRPTTPRYDLDLPNIHGRTPLHYKELKGQLSDEGLTAKLR